MAFKLIRHCGGVPASTTADDAAHGLDLTTLSPAGAYRVSEYAGQDCFIRITNEGTAVTATTGYYLKAGTSIVVVPEERPLSIHIDSATNANPAVLSTTGRVSDHGFVAGDQVAMTNCSVSAWNTLITNVNVSSVTTNTITVAPNSTSTGTFTTGTLRSNFTISVINETAGADAAIYVEEVVIGHTGL
jgi:hypothetical protein|tara:strand:- start:288 stop:851 length:564 start_codon:yes stop_codon:yes gene_type:complete